MTELYNVNKVDNTKILNENENTKILNENEMDLKNITEDDLEQKFLYKHERISLELKKIKPIIYHLNSLINKINNEPPEVIDISKKFCDVSLKDFLNDTPLYIKTSIDKIHDLIDEIENILF